MLKNKDQRKMKTADAGDFAGILGRMKAAAARDNKHQQNMNVQAAKSSSTLPGTLFVANMKSSGHHFFQVNKSWTVES